MKKNTRKIINIFGIIFLVELLSIFGYLIPEFRQISFIVIALLCLIVSLVDLRWGMLMIITELVIGSKGYLFYFDLGGIVISIRIAFWLIVMSVWLAKTIIKISKERQLDYFKIPAIFYLFFLVLIVGVLSGLWHNNDLGNIFYDFNNWLYFALIFPFWELFKNRKKDIWQVLIAALSWLVAKTYILLFVFSHNVSGSTEMLYGWVRKTGVGEITLIQGGFYRIFFQSHVFILLTFFIALIFVINKINGTEKIKNIFLKYIPLLSVLISVILLCFSRSFWVALIAGISAVAFYIFWKYNWLTFFKVVGLLIASAIVSVILVGVIVKFPYPSPLGGFSTADLLKNRAGQITGEAAVSSRWNLLPELWGGIKQAPIMGKGFGATITYKSNDPRVLEQNSTGYYTTYAFEWGWLDIWLKIGLLGVLIYATLILGVLKKGCQRIKKDDFMAAGLTIGLFVLIMVHFFTPYLNHPLGIGYLILTTVYFKNGLTK